ncbi:TonB-dependent receptor [Aquimarina sp. RZ0]|uniref:TonB-dependent receptor n=1 Tax=Aquimarina sp. RZ0 TaxID=2607730 RepID=UPI0011F0EB44|nr:TonB-dependent receptor [Aquimarina sp. RZ0]KAA1244932.1 TonB-dependent receptor [Aquimarina sp. RZ0]
MKPKKVINFICLLSFLSLSTISIAQEGTISGKVTGEKGIPLPGVSIQIKGTNIGVITDFDGNYNINAKQGDVFIFSSIGYATKEITVNGTIVDMQMETEVSFLNEVVVSTTRKPVRKLQATTAINSIGAKEISTLKPESFTEAIQNTPGVVIDETQGRKGGFNIRGFPGGSIYATTLIDGLPVSGIASQSGSQQEFFGIDQNVQNIEVVRGAAASLFGRAAAAGAINIISKTGGTEHHGVFSLTKYSNNSRQGHQFEGETDYRADFNFNGPITDKLRYNIGGYVLEDSGIKEQFAKDRGAQVRANFDYLFSENTSLRIYGSIFNNQFQNITDAPWDLENDRIAEGWHPANAFFNDPRNLDRAFGEIGVRQGFFNTAGATEEDGTPLRDTPGANREIAKGGNIGIDFRTDLGSGWLLSDRLRYNDFSYEDINEFNFSTFYTTDATVNRFNGEAYNQNRSFITEHRLTKQIKNQNSEHNISGGLFHSNAKRDRLGLNFVYASSVAFRNPEISSSFGFSTGTFDFPQPSPTSFVSNTSSHREEVSTGVFIGDEMVFNDRLSVNVTFRYDWLRHKFNNDPEKFRESEIDFAFSDFEENELKFEDFSYSIGANYTLGKSSAVYGNFVRAFSLPGSINLTTILPDDNEVVKNFELGYRAGLGDLTIDVTMFNTKIDNRTATVFDNNLGEFVERPAGSNKIFGGELSMIYAPKAVTGLLLRGSLTIQDSEYDEFFVPLSVDTNGNTNVDQNGDLFGLQLVGSGANAGINIAGLKVQNRPPVIYNINIAYSRKTWGADFGGYTYSGGYADALNLYELPNFSEYNLGGYYIFPLGDDEQLRFSVRIKNLFDGESARQLLVGGQNTDAGLIEKQNNPTRVGRLTSAVLQNPKRVLFTVGYKF